MSTYVTSFNWQSGGDCRLQLQHELGQTLGLGQIQAVAIAENQRGELREMDVVSNLSISGGKPGQGYPCIAWGGKQRSYNDKASHGWTKERQPCPSGGQDHNLVAFGGDNTSGSIDKATTCNACGGTGRNDFESETFLVAPPLTHNPYGDHESREGLLTTHTTGVRRLTPTECLLLQGFPDDWLDLEPPLSDSAKYRMTGNAVTVNVIRWIKQRLERNQ